VVAEKSDARDERTIAHRRAQMMNYMMSTRREERVQTGYRMAEESGVIMRNGAMRAVAANVRHASIRHTARQRYVVTCYALLPRVYVVRQQTQEQRCR